MMSIRNGVIQGTLNGVTVHCVLRPGVSIPKGTYKLLPAVQDPVFGTLILMVPASGQFDPKGKIPLSFAMDIEGQDAGNYFAKPRQGFVLSARAMPGSSNIVVNSGFSSLVESLGKGTGDVSIVCEHIQR